MHESWKKNSVLVLFKEAMPRNRFCEIFRFLRFEHKLEQSKRLKANKVFLFRLCETDLLKYHSTAILKVGSVKQDLGFRKTTLKRSVGICLELRNVCLAELQA